MKSSIASDPHTLLCYTTISGEGLRVVYRYELDEVFGLKQQMQFYRKAFSAGNAYYERLCGVYAAGSHNDYVMRVGYKLNQFGFRRDVAVQWARQAFPEYEKAASVVESCYNTKTEEFASRVTSRTYGREGRSAGVEEIQAFLRERIRLRHNVVTKRAECLAGIHPAKGGNSCESWQPLTLCILCASENHKKQ